MSTIENTRRRRSSGMTLTEMVIVLGIIGVLFGLLTPVLVRARKMARNTQCQSNLRRIFEGYKMYTNDNKGKKPMVTNRPSLELNDLPCIADVLESYTGTKIFRCPMDDQGFYEKERSSYEFNVTAYGKIAEDPLTFGGRPRPTPDPANTAAFYDYECFHGKKDSGHAKNAVFGDGHVETF